MSIVKVRGLIRKEWDPVSWDGGMWADSDEAHIIILTSDIPVLNTISYTWENQ